MNGNDRKKLAVGMIGMIGIAVIIFALFFGTHRIVEGGGGIAEACTPLSYNLDSNGSYIPPDDLICRNGDWINVTKESLGGEKEVYCNNFWELITVEYTSNGAKVTREEALGGQYCENGMIVNSPGTCGNFMCDVEETEDNCWVDCGVVSDWGAMKTAVDNDPELATFIESEGVFVYDSPEIESLAKEIEATNPETPLQAIKTLTRLVSNKVSYVFGGVAGNVQCGETSPEILNRGTGNCVDYSTIMIATLRRGFDIEGVGRVQIPTRQVAGCLSGFSSWKAVEYNVLDDNAGLRGQVLGHSWIKVWVGNDRWVMADPTTNTALAKSWAGYHEIEQGDGTQLCFVAQIEDKEFCSYFSTTVAGEIK
jgi:hypothetical protein